MLTEGFLCLCLLIVGAFVYLILMFFFTAVLIHCFATFLAYPLEIPRVRTTELIKSPKRIMTQLVFLQVLYILARLSFFSC